MPNIKNRDALLCALARALRPFDRSPLAVIEVVLHTPDGQSFEFGLDDVLETFGNDLYWDTRGNWADADKLTVTTF